jgi:hypothetical protein
MSKPKVRREDFIERDVVDTKEVTECTCGYDDPECLFCGEPATNCIGKGTAHICDDCLGKLEEAGLTLIHR